MSTSSSNNMTQNINSLNSLDEFPTMASAARSKVQKRKNVPTKVTVPSDGNTISLGHSTEPCTSPLSELKIILDRPSPPSSPTNAAHAHTRPPNISNIRTAPCRYVTNSGTGDWGVCTCKGCTYAHSMDELVTNACYYGDTCRYKDGNSTTGCKYLHPGETTWSVFVRLNLPFVLPHFSVSRDKLRPNVGQNQPQNPSPADSYTVTSDEPATRATTTTTTTPATPTSTAPKRRTFRASKGWVVKNDKGGDNKEFTPFVAAPLTSPIKKPAAAAEIPPPAETTFFVSRKSAVHILQEIVGNYDIKSVTIVFSD